jgi:diguanylate cyclase (GGDEF)-like protein
VDVIRRPVRLQDGREAGVSASIGIALYPEHGRDGTALIAQADAAMYRAKREGKNRYRFAELPPSTLS